MARARTSELARKKEKAEKDALLAKAVDYYNQHHGAVSLRDTADLFKVKRTRLTTHAKIDPAVTPISERSRPGRKSTFDNKSELDIIDHIIYRGRMRKPLTKKQLRCYIYSYAFLNAIPVPKSWDVECTCSCIWLRAFMYRHKLDVISKRAKPVASHRDFSENQVSSVNVVLTSSATPVDLFYDNFDCTIH